MATPEASPVFAPVPINFGGVNNTSDPTNGTLTPISATATAQVPTKAPSGQTSTGAPAATPTTVVNSQPAQQQVTQMGTVLTQAQQDIKNQSAIKSGALTSIPGGSSDFTVQPGVNYTTTQPAKTPEQQIVDTPDTGNQWLYDTQGNRVQMPINGSIPAGFSTVNPTTGPGTPVTDQTTDAVGNVYKQFSDGTYGKYNPLGAYVGTASAADFSNSKAAEGIFTSLQQVINGTYPLTANQQAQLDGIKASFKSLITQQTTANANFTGATTVAENLYGMGNSLSGLGEIKGTVDAGIAKIADLNSKMVSAVAEMESAFQKDDLDMLKTAYDLYSGAAKNRQDEVDKLQAAADAKAKDIRDFNEQKRQFNIQEQDKVTAMINTTQTDAAKGGAPQSILSKIAAATNATDAIVAAGEYLQASTNPDVAQYLAYRNAATAAGKTAVPFESWQNTRDYNKAYLTAKGSAEGKAAGTPVDTTTGTFNQSASSKADVPAALRPYANKSASGSWYIDLSSASAASRAKLAAMAGPDVSVITDKNQAADLKNQADAISKLGIIGKVMADINNKTAASRDLGGAGLTQASILAQTNPKAAAALALNDSALDILKAISGVQGFRGNKEAIDQVREALPKATDTQDVAAQKLSIVAQQIQAREEAVLGGALGPNNYTNFVIRTEDQSKTALVNASKADTNTAAKVTDILKTTNPTTGQPYTYTEAAQILGVDVPAQKQTGGFGGTGTNSFSY